MEVSGYRAELCDVCLSEPANGFCDNCTEYMCNKCFQNHTTVKPSANHVFTPLAQAGDLKSRKSLQEKCKIHTTENIRFYCRKHDLVACRDCIVSNHYGCKPQMTMIKNVCTNCEESTEFKELLRRIQGYEVENDENTKELAKNTKQNESLIETALDGINKFRKEINDYVDQIEKLIVDLANKHAKENELMCLQLRQKIATVAKDIDELKEKLDTNIHQDEALFIRMIECRNREHHVQQSVAEIKTKNTIKTFLFEPEQKLKDIIVSNVKFGTIQISDSKDVNQASTENKVKPDTKVNPGNKVKPEKKVIKVKHKTEQPYTLKQVLAEKKFLPPDPRSAGFDVGKRVRHCSGYVYFKNTGTGRGTIVSVDPRGWVEVSWDQGSKLRVTAGYQGLYSVQLL